MTKNEWDGSSDTCLCVSLEEGIMTERERRGLQREAATDDNNG